MKIVNMVNVSLLSNEIQNKLAEEYELSDASQHMLAQTEDGKFFLFKDVRCTSVTPAGADNDPKEVTCTIKCEKYNDSALDNTVEKMLIMWQESIKKGD